MIWSFVQVIGRQGINFLFFAMLALFLIPSELGVVGVAIVISAFIQSFSEFGFGAALIQRRHILKGHFSSVFFVNLLIGISLGGLCFFFADVIAAIFKAEQIASILRFLSVGFLVNSFSLVHIAILQKELKFRDLANRDIISSIAGCFVGLMALYGGAGVWSIVAQLLTYYITGALIIWHLSPWRPNLKEFSSEHIKDLWPYSSRILMINLLNFGVKNTDKILIGGLLGPYALGIYTFGYNLVILPINSINAAIGTYLFPQYSAMQDKISEIRFSYLKVMKFTLFCLSPLMIIFSQTAHIFVDLIWGDAWAESFQTIKVFCALAIFGSFIAPSGQLMKTFGKPNWLLYWSIFTVILSGILIFFGIKVAGLIGSSLGLLLSCVVSIPIIMLIIKNLIHVDAIEVIKLLRPIMIASTCALLVFFTSEFFGFYGLLSATFSSLLAFIVYLILFICLDSSAKNSFKSFLSGERSISKLFALFSNHPY